MYRLAAAFRRPVCELDISVDEFAHWIAYERQAPFADQTNEFMLAQIAMLIVSMTSKSRPKVTDFMLSQQTTTPEPDQALDIDAQIRNVFRQIGGLRRG